MSDDVYLQLGQLARSMQSQQYQDLDTERLLRELTEIATHILPGVQHAGVTLVVNRRRRTVESVAPTGEVPKLLDKLQDDHQQGPCLDALWNQITVRVDDYETETRWPTFVADLLSKTSVRSSLSIQLFTNENELGTLNLYSEKPSAFTPGMEDVAVALGAQAAIGLANARSNDELRSALASRDIIGQAKGIVMERFKIGSTEAFTLLTKLSQESNTPLYELARKLVFTGKS